MEKVIVVGTGPAGLTAALYCARAGLAPLVIDGMQPGGQLTTTTEVENYPGFPEGIDGTELVTRMRSQAERFGAKFKFGEVVASSFSVPPLTLTVSDGEDVTGQTIVVATGASALYLGLESEQKLLGRGVSACATCDGAFYRDKPVAVVGGGDTAMEEALFLARLCSKVTIIHRRDQLRASKIMADRVMAHAKIDIRWNAVVEEVLDVQKQEVTGLRLRDVKEDSLSTLVVDGVFMGIGHKPNTDAFKGQLDLNEQGFVIATDTKTSVKGVFAAGDVQDPTYKQAVTAAGSGCKAALEIERFLESQGQ